MIATRTRLPTAALCAVLAATLTLGATRVPAAEPVYVGARRELFVDRLLIDRMTDATLQLHRPVDRGRVLTFEARWEGPSCAYVTLIRAADGKYQMYYRGAAPGSTDTSDKQVTCYAESADGIAWTKPELDLFPRAGRARTNIVLADAAPVTHNSSPFIDARPDVPADQRYKAVGGYNESGLFAYASADGVRWRRIHDGPVLTREQLNQGFVFDSQNVPFYSVAEEGRYVLYYRVYKDRKRRIARVESDDFVRWSSPTIMEYARDGGAAPIEELYTNQTAPYFRAPHLYVATAARFMINRQVLTTRQAGAIKVDPKFFHDCSDAILMTSRGGHVYERQFMTAFVAPGIGAENWTSRTNYPALGVVQAGPDEMSFYVNQNYGQQTSHLRRYSLRLDGFASAHAGYDGGEMLTKPLRFDGARLLPNFQTSAPGGLRVEVQDERGAPFPAFALADCPEVIGNEIERAVAWGEGADLGTLAGKTVRLRFAMKDAELYAIRFAPASEDKQGAAAR